MMLHAGHEKKRGVAGRDFTIKYDAADFFLASLFSLSWMPRF
jgi:hypothetical protein